MSGQEIQISLSILYSSDLMQETLEVLFIHCCLYMQTALQRKMALTRYDGIFMVAMDWEASSQAEAQLYKSLFFIPF